MKASLALKNTLLSEVNKDMEHFLELGVNRKELLRAYIKFTTKDICLLFIQFKKYYKRKKSVILGKN